LDKGCPSARIFEHVLISHGWNTDFRKKCERPTFNFQRSTSNAEMENLNLNLNSN
jgi:hypothetical protein